MEGALRRLDRIPRLVEARPSICRAQCCEDFDPLYLVPFLLRKIGIFKAREFAVRWSINAARICFPEIGGMKNLGRAQSGISSWRLENWFSLMKVKGLGSWMEYMTEIVISSGARDLTKRRSSTLNLQRDQCFVEEVFRLRSG